MGMTPFGGGGAEEVDIITRLRGQRQVTTGLTAEAAAMGELGAATAETGLTMERTARRSFLMNQAMFTMRRFLYMGTLALTAFAAATLKWGYDFNTSMQQGRIAIGQFLGSTSAANKELRLLFNFAAYTPFQFKDIVNASRVMLAFHFSLAMTNRTLRNLVDALAATGRDTPAALNRVSTALGHMMSIGHITGQVLLQLARDGIPGVYEAVKKYFGLTDAQMKNIGALRLPAAEVMKAINQYIEQSSMHGLAKKMAMGSLRGLLTTTRDFISQIMGDIESRPLRGIQRRLPAINAALQRYAADFHHGGLTAVFSDIDRRHGTDMVGTMHAFQSAMHSLWLIVNTEVIPVLRGFWRVIQPLKVILMLVALALGVVAHNAWLVKPILALLIIDFIRARVTALYFAAAERQAALMAFLLARRQAYLNIWMLASYRIQKLTAAAWLLLSERVRFYIMWQLRMIAIEIATRVAMIRAAAAMFLLRLQTIALAYRLGGLSQAFRLVAMWIGADWLALLGPIGAAIALISVLTILYFKWKAFHDIVNDTAKWIWKNWIFMMGFISLLPGIGPGIALLGAVVRYWKSIYTWANAAANAMRNAFSWTKHGIGRVASFAFKHTIGAIPGLASGGQVRVGGSVLVGERGPEILSLPRGATVQPVPGLGNFDWGQEGIGGIHITVGFLPINLDGKQIAQAQAQVVTDKAARQ